MKLAIISDIHSNHKALEEFLEVIKKEKVKGVIGLGDYITDGPYPRKTLDLLDQMQEKYPCYMIRGNREEYLMDNAQEPKGWKPSSPSGALYYTARNISQEDIDFFTSLSSEKLIQIDDLPPIYLCHGAPGVLRGNFEYDIPLKEKSMQELKTSLLLGGHTHHQEICKMYNKTYVNPGSLGLAINKTGRKAEFAMIEYKEDKWVPTLHCIDYDVEGYLKEFTDSGLDELALVLNKSIKKTIKTGINYFYYAVVEACKLSGQSLYEIPENIWDEVATILDL